MVGADVVQSRRAPGSRINPASVATLGLIAVGRIMIASVSSQVASEMGVRMGSRVSVAAMGREKGAGSALSAADPSDWMRSRRAASSASRAAAVSSRSPATG